MTFLTWKTYYFLRRSIVRLSLFILSPVMMILLMNWLNIQHYYTMIYMISMGWFINVILFNVEDLLFSEALIASPFDIKTLWRAQNTIRLAMGVIWPFMCLLIYLVLFKQLVLIDLLVQSIACGVFGYGLLLNSTVHYSDYSKVKVMVSSIVAVLHISIVASLLLGYFPLQLMVYGIPVIFVVGCVLILIAHLLFGEGNPELLLIHTKDLVNSSKDHSQLIME